MHLKLLVSLALTGTASATSLIEALSSTKSLSTLGGLLLAYPDVAKEVGAAKNITILAPSNDAVAKFLTAEVNATIAADPSVVRALLSYHFVKGVYKAADFTATPAFPHTLLTNATYTNVTDGQVVKAETMDHDHRRHTAVMITSGLSATSTVETADVVFDNGVIHVIDTVLTIPVSPSATANAANLTSLTAALALSNLVSTVDSAKDITVFAPQNTAFAAVSNLVSSLSTAQIATVLSYHVIGGTVAYSTTLKDGESIKTLSGATVKVSISNGKVKINNSTVVVTDVLLSNGVAHVIDTVLTPSNSTGTGTGSSSSPASTPKPSSPAVAGGNQHTAAIGAAALFGGAALLLNW